MDDIESDGKTASRRSIKDLIQRFNSLKRKSSISEAKGKQLENSSEESKKTATSSQPQSLARGFENFTGDYRGGASAILIGEVAQREKSQEVEEKVLTADEKTAAARLLRDLRKVVRNKPKVIELLENVESALGVDTDPPVCDSESNEPKQMPETREEAESQGDQQNLQKVLYREPRSPPRALVKPLASPTKIPLPSQAQQTPVASPAPVRGNAMRSRIRPPRSLASQPRQGPGLPSPRRPGAPEPTGKPAVVGTCGGHKVSSLAEVKSVMQKPLRERNSVTTKPVNLGTKLRRPGVSVGTGKENQC